jgi:hypothetical protein
VEVPPAPPSLLLRLQFRVLMFVTSGRFSLALMSLIVGNTVVLAMEHYDEDPSFSVRAAAQGCLRSTSGQRCEHAAVAWSACRTPRGATLGTDSLRLTGKGKCICK